jgi:hypothetical protein
MTPDKQLDEVYNLIPSNIKMLCKDGSIPERIKCMIDVHEQSLKELARIISQDANDKKKLYEFIGFLEKKFNFEFMNEHWKFLTEKWKKEEEFKVEKANQ